MPYFVDRAPKNLVPDGSHPTVLYGYGGFEISLQPRYSGTIGRAWLAHGGVLRRRQHPRRRRVRPALAPGGAEGATARAPTRTSRPSRRTSSRARSPHRRIWQPMGGSNGGLLMGNMLTQYPQLFGAVVCQVPLLDMKRYTHLSAGASWIAEYGDPDKPDEWAFIRTFSPYQNVLPNDEVSADAVRRRRRATIASAPRRRARWPRK